MNFLYRDDYLIADAIAHGYRAGMTQARTFIAWGQTTLADRGKPLLGRPNIIEDKRYPVWIFGAHGAFDMNWNRTSLALAAILMVLAIGLRLHGLAEKPLWLDEIITYTRANLPISELIANSFENKHFPTYFLLVRFFDAPIINEWMLRLPSVIFGGIAVLSVAVVGTEVRSLGAGVMAAMLMALSPFDVQFGQEARPYTLASCLILVALWGLVRIVQERQKGVFISWAAYTIGTVGALNVLFESVFWLLASNLAVIVLVRRSPSLRTTLLRNWLPVQGFVVVAWIPGLMAMLLANQGDPLSRFHWIPPTTLHHVWSVISAVYLFRISDMTTFGLFPTLVPGLGVVVALLALFGAWRLRADLKLLTVIGLAMMMMPIAIVVISIFHAFWIPRYLLWSTGPFFVLAGIGAAALPRHIFPFAAAALLVGGLVNLAPYYRYETKPRWDLAAAYLSANAQPSDSIMTDSPAAKYVLSAYGSRYNLDRPVLHASNVSHVASKIQDAGNIWVIYGRVGQVSDVSAEELAKIWSTLGKHVSTIKFGRQVTVLRFEHGTPTISTGGMYQPSDD